MSEAGVLVTQFNRPEAWQLCPRSEGACSFTRDRRSTTMLYYRPAGSARLLYSNEMGGIVIRPAGDGSLLLCAYAADAGSRAKACRGEPRPRHPPSTGCVPGCVSHTTGYGDGSWCDARRAESTGNGWCGGLPFAPPDLGTCLSVHDKTMAREHKYNEVVIDAYAYADQLPGVIEAFFVLKSSACAGACIETARQAHRMFHTRYGQRAAEVPLLTLDLADVERPFSDRTQS